MAAEPGWYDDGTGVQRWWDGVRWTEHYADLSTARVELHAGANSPGSPDEFGGIVVDARVIRCGRLTQPIGGVVALVATADEILKRPAYTTAAHTRSLFSSAGPIKPRYFARLDRRTLHVAVESAQQLWLAPVGAHDEARARQFASWVNASAQHYRYG
ncbi:DUF2510 domain-containing protein [Microbacterium sp. B2969]|uniref:DUF2510 domain-containing protein n=1 Tax=Microbacterium alkaliflavum TaxID=3248839 RepID=A0ABW7Q6H3_9MICO